MTILTIRLLYPLVPPGAANPTRCTFPPQEGRVR
jgi:hypothetical protein